MKLKYLICICLILGIVSMVNVKAIYFDINTEFTVNTDNKYTSDGHYFNKIEINDKYIGFNNTFFNLTCLSATTTNISFLHNNIAGASIDEIVLRYNVTALQVNVYYWISGFAVGSYYNISCDGVHVKGMNATANGSINFDTNISGWEEVIITRGSYGSTSTSSPNEWGTTIHSNVSPVNNSENNSLTLQYSITIKEQDGINGFNYTIECNNSQITSNNGVTNGTKTLSLSNLAYNTTYTVWVNSTNFDGTNTTRSWYTFKTRAISGTIEGAEIFIVILLMMVMSEIIRRRY